MALTDEVIYPVIIEREDDGYFYTIPDIDTNGLFEESLEEVVTSAKEVIALCLDEPKPYPKATPLETLKQGLSEGQEVLLVSVWMPYQVAQVKEAYKKKTLTIPVWLDMLATEKNINFSRVLTDGLKRELKIQ
ncbi:type II toxin-antitoxin system HicB family antitoxin [Peptococcus simiae]|uniref:type II toxin-antitoxin system HicB family antitoxin n=1 Tax=Peptococcus simiae TaxID=1643805 RepID=UPI00397FF4D3